MATTVLGEIKEYILSRNPSADLGGVNTIAKGIDAIEKYAGGGGSIPTDNLVLKGSITLGKGTANQVTLTAAELKDLKESALNGVYYRNV